jgi:hypothetical protein
MKGLYERAQHGYPASYPIAQFPNAPLLVALGARVTAAITGGAAHDHAMAVFYVGLSAWAWLELTGGVNLVRRGLGAAGLVYVVVEIA